MGHAYRVLTLASLQVSGPPQEWHACMKHAELAHAVLAYCLFGCHLINVTQLAQQETSPSLSKVMQSPYLEQGGKCIPDQIMVVLNMDYRVKGDTQTSS